jgi:hypothetical protein
MCVGGGGGGGGAAQRSFGSTSLSTLATLRDVDPLSIMNKINAKRAAMVAAPAQYNGVSGILVDGDGTDAQQRLS